MKFKFMLGKKGAPQLIIERPSGVVLSILGDERSASEEGSLTVRVAVIDRSVDKNPRLVYNEADAFIDDIEEALRLFKEREPLGEMKGVGT